MGWRGVRSPKDPSGLAFLRPPCDQRREGGALRRRPRETAGRFPSPGPVGRAVPPVAGSGRGVFKPGGRYTTDEIMARLRPERVEGMGGFDRVPKIDPAPGAIGANSDDGQGVRRLALLQAMCFTDRGIGGVVVLFRLCTNARMSHPTASVLP